MRQHHRSALVSLSLVSLVAAQNAISTDFQVPPLQWIRLTTSGPAPPVLKDSSIGYDDTNHLLILFGGETAQGLAYSGTHILDTKTLQWRIPKTSPPNLADTPSARSLALAGPDSAASYRRSFSLFGGRDQQGKALSDIWFFNYDQEFWYNATPVMPNGPPARYNAVGGSDPTQPPNAELLTTFRVAGGTDGTQEFPLSDVWTLTIKDTLAANVQTINGQWVKTTTSTVDSKVGSAGTVMTKNRLAAFGGCDFKAGGTYSGTCAKQDAYMATFGGSDSSNWNAMGKCGPARYGATMVPNLNVFSPAFATQLFVMLGDVDNNEWSDSGAGPETIEILDVAQGTWARLQPSCDPGPSGGVPVCPSARQGAAVVAFPGPIIGETKLTWDIIVFGGKDSSGKYLNDLWMLRGYGGVINGTTSGNWGGYGTGQLETGPEASGMGVTVKFLPTCATAVTTSTTGTSSPTGTGPAVDPHNGAASYNEFSTSPLHMALSAVSVALMLPAVALYRLSSPSMTDSFQHRRMSVVYIAALIGTIAYALGVTGFAFSITSIVRNPPPSSVSSSQSLIAESTPDTQSTFLKTAHGQAGLAFFILLYGVAPFFAYFLRRYRKRKAALTEEEDKARKDSLEITRPNRFSGVPSMHMVSDGGDTDVDDGSPPPNKHSLWPGAWRKKRTHSDDSTKVAPSPPSSGFEVLNRGKGFHSGSGRSGLHSRPRTLNEMGWRQGDDFAMSHIAPAPHSPQGSPEGAGDGQSGHPLVSHSPFSHPTKPPPRPPTTLEVCFHLAFQALLAALCIYSLVALWNRAPIFAFALFLAWTALFYLLVFLLAWQGRPRRSLLATIISRLRAEPPPPLSTTPLPPRSTVATPEPGMSTPLPPNSPYSHPTTYRRLPREDGLHGPDPEDDDGDEDEAERQWRMEQEMGRRDVSIVTVPKRKLVIANAE